MCRQMFKSFECARESDGDDDSEMSISDVATAKMNMLECNERMNETESCDPLKEYLARARKSILNCMDSSQTGCLILKRSKLEMLG